MRFLPALALLPLVAALAAACGDGPDPVATPTPTIEAPVIPEGNIDAIKPEHGTKVRQADTRNPDPNNPANGVCVQVNFEGLPEYFQWVRMFFDDQEVTVSPDILLIAPTTAQQSAPEGGWMCYMPPEGLSIGVHTVTVGIQNPRNPAEPTRQIVQWQFEVIP